MRGHVFILIHVVRLTVEGHNDLHHRRVHPGEAKRAYRP